MAGRVTFRNGAEIGNFELNGGRVRVNSVLQKFGADLVEYEDDPGDYTVMNPCDKSEWSLRQFEPGSTVLIRFKSKPGENHDVRQSVSSKC